MSYPMNRVSQVKQPPLIERGITVSLDVRILERDKDFKSTIVAELRPPGLTL